SLEQATVVAETAAECPGSEGAMLDAARKGSLRSLKDKARQTQLAEIDPEVLGRRRHQARTFRHWRDRLGMVGFAGALPPEVGLPLVNRLDAEADRLRRQARRDGGVESWHNYAADALVKLSSGSGSGRAPRADLVIVCDLRAYRRGHAHPGEPVHLIGGGPIPVSLVKELAEDAFLKAVLHDGVDLHTVKHFGRHIKAEVRAALELGRPPEFTGITCAEAHCDRRYHLEWDHIDPHANWGPSAYDNFQGLCWAHHQEKTSRDRQGGLLGPREPGPDPP
ncbi:MAG: HNH endonuclease, partial [Acidimicrobiia bacterium]